MTARRTAEAPENPRDAMRPPTRTPRDAMRLPTRTPRDTMRPPTRTPRDTMRPPIPKTRAGGVDLRPAGR